MERKPPLIIPIFLPNLGCSAQCLFCNQKVVVKEAPPPSSVQAFIERSLRTFSPERRGKERQVAFYGGSFTAMRREDQVLYLKKVEPFLLSGEIDSIRISTRPDAIDREILLLLKKYGVKTVEIGAQSLVDEVLIRSKRGHTAEDTFFAISELRKFRFEVGLHLMIGLPGEDRFRFCESLDRTIELRPDFVRIHPTLVLKGSPLEDLWKSGGYFPLSLSEAIEWLKEGILRLEQASIPLARVGLQPTQELEAHLLAGPYHPALHQLIESAIFYDMATLLLQNFIKGEEVIFLCNPKEASNLRGQRNENFQKLKREFNLSHISIEEREEWPRSCLGLKIQGREVITDRKSIKALSKG
ncbi:MAG: elongator complex protein 3 [Thermodesulfobacteriota bacterium]